MGGSLPEQWLRSSHTMSDPNNWLWQIFTEDIGQAQQILRMVEQVVIFAQKFLVGDHVGVLVSHICSPDTPDLELRRSRARIIQQSVPQWFIRFFGISSDVGCHNCDLSLL